MEEFKYYLSMYKNGEFVFSQIKYIIQEMGANLHLQQALFQLPSPGFFGYQLVHSRLQVGSHMVKPAVQFSKYFILSAAQSNFKMAFFQFHESVQQPFNGPSHHALRNGYDNKKAY